MEDWIYHEQGPMPVPPSTIVEVAMSDGSVLFPMPARDIDWDYPEDPVLAYRVSSE